MDRRWKWEIELRIHGFDREKDIWEYFMGILDGIFLNEGLKGGLICVSG